MIKRIKRKEKWKPDPKKLGQVKPGWAAQLPDGTWIRVSNHNEKAHLVGGRKCEVRDGKIVSEDNSRSGFTLYRANCDIVAVAEWSPEEVLYNQTTIDPLTDP